MLPPEKTTLKKPSLIRVKLKYEVTNQETISLTNRSCSGIISSSSFTLLFIHIAIRNKMQDCAFADIVFFIYLYLFSK